MTTKNDSQILQDETAVARPPGAFSRAGRWCRCNPFVAGVLVLLVVITAGSLFSLWTMKTSLQLEEAQRDAAETETKRQVSRHAVSSGMRLLDKERVTPALAWFGKALEAVQDVEGRAVVHQARIAAWVHQCPTLLNLWTMNSTGQWNESSRHGQREVSAEFGAIHGHDVVLGFAADGRTVIVGTSRRAVLHYEYAANARDGRTTGESMKWDEVRLIEVDGSQPEPSRGNSNRKQLAKAISSDGRYVAIQRPVEDESRQSFGSYELEILDTATGQEVGKPLPHKWGERAVFSPDSKLLAVAENDYIESSVGKPLVPSGKVQIWNVETGQLATSLIKIPQNRINTIQFTPDAKRLVTGGPGARVWDVRSGQPLTEKFHDDNVRQVAVSPDGQRVATAVAISGGLGEVRVWDIESGKPISPVWEHPGFVDALVFGHEGQSLLVVGQKTAQVWNVDSGERMGDPLIDGESVRGAGSSPDGKQVVTWGRSVRVWNADSWQATHPVVEHVEPVLAANFSPDSKQLLTLDASGTTRLWGLPAQGMPMQLVKHEGHQYLRAMFSPDGKQLVTSNGSVYGHSGDARRWNVETAEQVGETFKHPSGVWKSDFSGDGKRLFTASGHIGDSGTVAVWDATTGERLGAAQDKRPVIDLVSNHDGSRIVTRSANSIPGKPSYGTLVPKNQNECLAGWSVSLWAVEDDGQSSRRLRVLRERNDGWLSGAYISANRRCELICVVTEESVQVFHFDTGEAVAKRIEVSSGPGPVARITGAEIADDGNRLVTITGDSTSGVGHARIWDVATGKALSAPFATGGGHAASFSPDGRWVVTCRENSARIWDATTGEPRSQPLNHQKMIFNVRFDPTGLFVATASADRTAQIWDAETGQPVGPPLQHGSVVTDAVFHPIGSHLVTTTMDGNARLWQISLPKTRTQPWQSLIRAIAGGRLDDTGTLVAMEPDELQKEWSKWQAETTNSNDAH